jgi:ribonuclease III
MLRRVEGELTEEILQECETALGYRFYNRDLLKNCLTHASGANHRLASNERLEFLGDAVMGLLVCEMLFHRFPEEREGELTRIKSVVVSRHTCAKISESLGLPRYLLLGKGLSINDQIPQSVAAAVFESLIAGVYLDGGLEEVRLLIERVMGPEAELAAAVLAEGVRRHADLPAARREGAGPLEVFQNHRGDRREHLSPGLGGEQKGRRATGSA